MNTLLADLQEANASFRCGTCPGGPEEECDDQCEKHRLEHQAEELRRKGYIALAEIRCGNCALWGCDKRYEERANARKFCPTWDCWTDKNAWPIGGCFAKKAEA